MPSISILIVIYKALAIYLSAQSVDYDRHDYKLLTNYSREAIQQV